MKLFTLLSLLSFLALTTYAQRYTNTSKTAISFKIKNAGFTVNGKFKTVTAEVVFDADNVNNISLKGIAYTKSINTGIGLRDQHLREKLEYFNVDKYETMTMESYKVVKVSDTKYTVYSKLTMKGVTKNIKTAMNVKSLSNGVELSSSFTVNRLDWGLGGSSFTMGDMVTVSIATMVN